MAKTFKFKSDEEIVNKASFIFEKLGLSLDSALTLFFRQTILQNGLPFKLVLPEIQGEIKPEPHQDLQKPEQKTEQVQQQEKTNHESPLFAQMKTNLFNEKTD